MPKVIRYSDCRLYADDTILSHTARNPVDLKYLQEDINSLIEWSQTWHMKFKINKCSHIQIGAPIPGITLNLGDAEIPQTDSIKYLGVYIDRDLTWEKHITYVSKKANGTLFLLQRGLAQAPTKMKLLAYKTIVRPVLEYASQVWSPHLKSQSENLQKIQRRAIPWVFRVHKYDSVSDVMRDNEIKSLSDRCTEADVSFLRRLEFGDYQLRLSDYVAANTKHNTRHGTINPHFTTNVFKYPYCNRIRGEIKFYL